MPGMGPPRSSKPKNAWPVGPPGQLIACLATGPFEYQLSPRVFVPSLTSEAIAEVLDVERTDVVLDVGCGGGFLAILAARRPRPAPWPRSGSAM